jgi:hypothetical protein
MADAIVETLPDIANGWSKPSLREMEHLLAGDPLIFEGRLRVMPAIPGSPRWRSRRAVSPLSLHALLAAADEHALAGRIPLLKEATKRAIAERTYALARREYRSAF